MKRRILAVVVLICGWNIPLVQGALDVTGAARGGERAVKDVGVDKPGVGLPESRQVGFVQIGHALGDLRVVANSSFSKEDGLEHVTLVVQDDLAPETILGELQFAVDRVSRAFLPLALSPNTLGVGNAGVRVWGTDRGYKVLGEVLWRELDNGPLDFAQLPLGALELSGSTLPDKESRFQAVAAVEYTDGVVILFVGDSGVLGVRYAGTSGIEDVAASCGSSIRILAYEGSLARTIAAFSTVWTTKEGGPPPQGGGNQCCVLCGGPSSCCCEWTSNCVSEDRKVTCDNKYVCTCSGSNCNCTMKE